MFISQVFYEELAAARAEARMLGETNRALQVHLDTTKLRLSQIERERAQMLHALTGAKFDIFWDKDGQIVSGRIGGRTETT